mgnify:CR=1 FL=1
MSGGEGKGDKRCAGAFWDGVDIKKLCYKNWLCKGENIMLAFNENGKLTEYEETNFLKYVIHVTIFTSKGLNNN